MKLSLPFLGSLFAGLLALQGPSFAQLGGTGGTYNGPGDTVPNGGTTGSGQPVDQPPPIGGPGDTTGGVGGGGGTVEPPPVAGPGGAGTGATPSPGTIGLLPPEEPTTPDAQPPVADRTSWQLWWHYNRWDHLPVGRAEKMLARSSSEGYFLGRGQVQDDDLTPRATESQITQIVRPALLEALQESQRRELIVFGLQALAKLRGYPAEETWSFEAAVRKHLQDGNQNVSEGALLAIGIRGDLTWATELFAVLHDTERGRELLGRSKVGHRQRAFAAYALALMADRVEDELWRLEVHRQLASALPDERPEVQAAVLIAIGHAAMPWEEATASGTTSRGPVTLGDQIRLIAEFLDDGRGAVLARSQAPQALGLLAQEAPEHLRAEAAEALLSKIGPHTKASTEVKNGAVQALGSIGTSDALPLNQSIRKDLERVITGPGADRLTRYLALISLARVASRAGAGEAPLEGLEPTRRFLLRQLTRNRGMQQAWTALALGILEEGVLAQGAMPSADACRALRELLEGSRNGDTAGAAALALGMTRDQEAIPLLLAVLKDSGSGVLRGYAALSLGMIGDRRALQPLRDVMQASKNLPGSLQRIAIGLSLLGDAQASPVLGALLVKTGSPEVQASIAAALGWVKDPTPLPQLAERLQKDSSDISRAWISVAVGRIADRDELPWNASLSVGVNYDVPLITLRDINSQNGVLDYP